MINPNPFPGLYREQHLLVIERGCVFPQRCVCCDAESATPATWLNRYQLWREAKDRSFGVINLCDPCRRKFFGLELIAGTFVIVFLSLLLINKKMTSFAAAALLASSLFNLFLCGYRRRIALEKLDDEKAWFSGFPPAFLDQLPDFRERRKSRQDADEPSGEKNPAKHPAVPALS